MVGSITLGTVSEGPAASLIMDAGNENRGMEREAKEEGGRTRNRRENMRKIVGKQCTWREAKEEGKDKE